MEVEQDAPRGKRERKPSAKAAVQKEAKQARSDPRLSATLYPACDPLRIGTFCIPSLSAFAMERKGKLELAHASMALLGREARLRHK